MIQTLLIKGVYSVSKRKKERTPESFWDFFFFFLRQGLAMYATLASNSTILLPQPPKYWDYSCMSPHLA
jgi:hypothetical protein